MIALIRARFPNTSAKDVWSDIVANNWMDPAIPFSMAHFWKMATFNQVAMPYVLFPPVVVNDPRQQKPDDRTKLVKAVLDAVDAMSKPNWSQFDRCIIFFAQQTDLFGGGGYATPSGGTISPAVFDSASGFDQTCQEIGHTYGLNHELGAWHYDDSNQYTDEYGCPYSIMSAAADFSFERAPDPRLPGVQGPTNPQRSIGPYLPTAHLYINQNHPVNPNGTFNDPGSVTYLPTSYENTPFNMRLYARDSAIAAWPSRQTVLAVVPPIVPGGDTHFLELRRRDGSYDQGIGNASIIILSANFYLGSSPVQDPSSLRLRYVDRIDIEGVAGDLDYHSFSGRFVVRVNDSAPDFAYADLTIAGGNAWQDFRIVLDDAISNSLQTHNGDWQHALVAPCPTEAKGDFKFRVSTSETFFVLQARSVGYEQPSYLWKIEGVPLDATTNSLDLQVQCRDNTGSVINASQMHTVKCTIKVNSGRLELNVAGAFADIVLGIEVTAGESSPSVMKNYYPDRTLSTTVRADNMVIEWDGAYQEASKACWKRLQDFNDRFKEVAAVGRVHIGDPDPPYFSQINVRELIRVLAERDWHSARAVARVIADRSAVSIDEVLTAAMKSERR
jgi:hypothetical protein